jgi:antirestriction protein ArdC
LGGSRETATLRKGEKGSLTVYADSITRTETSAQSGEETLREIHYMKGYTVFNVEQIDDLPEQCYARPAPRFEPLPRIAHAESFFAATGIDIRHGGNSAYYAIGTDHMMSSPAPKCFCTIAFEPTVGPEDRISMLFANIFMTTSFVCRRSYPPIEAVQSFIKMWAHFWDEIRLRTACQVICL